MLNKNFYLNEIIRLYVFINPFMGSVPETGEPELKKEQSGLLRTFIELYPKFMKYDEKTFKNALISTICSRATKMPVHTVLQFCRENHVENVDLPKIDYNDPFEAYCKGLGFQETLEVTRNWDFETGGPLPGFKRPEMPKKGFKQRKI